MGTSGVRPVRGHQVHRGLKVLQWDVRVIRCGLLVRRVLDAVARERAPVSDPHAAKLTVFVPD